MQAKKSILALLAAAVLAIPLAFAVGEPENVSGLTANAVSESAIELSWNSAQDAAGGLVNHYRLYYGTTSVQTAGEGDYDHEVDTANNNTSYTVRNLDAGTPYYFSITAIDSADVESEAYSLEAIATTLGGSGTDEADEPASDTTSPVVVSVTATNKTQVVMTFSEAVVLPGTMPEAAFSINEQVITANSLEIHGVVLGTNGTSVVLETDEQAPNVNYVVTAGIAITDLAGNPIVSGNTDSGLFLGSSLDTPLAEDNDEEATEVPNCGNDEVCFYDHLKTCTPATVTQVKDQTQIKRQVSVSDNEGECVLTYEVAGILDLNNPKTLECRLETASLEDRVTRVAEAEGALLDDEAEAKENCIGSYYNEFVQAMFAAAPEVDTTPPENITGLLLSYKEQLEAFVVMLRWTASINSAGDLVDQILYMSLDRGTTYDTGKSLGAAKVTHEVPNLEGGKEYTFKVTTKDASGNESTGVVKSIRLPQTGAAIGFLLFGSSLSAYYGLRRKRK